MRLRKTESIESLSVEQIFHYIVDSLKSYIKEDQSTLNDVLEDWIETVNGDYESSDEDIPITIPIEKKHNVDFSLSNWVCYVGADFSIKHAEIHLLNEEESLRLFFFLPLLKDVMDVICDNESSYRGEVVCDSAITNMTDVERFVQKCKTTIEAYTKDLSTILDTLDKMDSENLVIHNILRDEKKNYPDL